MEDDSVSPVADGVVGDEFSSLMSRFSSMGVANSREVLSANFSQIVGVSLEQAHFFLDASGWVLDAAVNLYLDSSGASAPFRRVPQPPSTEAAEAAMLQWALEASRASQTYMAPDDSSSGSGGMMSFNQSASSFEAPSHFSAPASSTAPIAFGAGSGAPVFGFGQLTFGANFMPSASGGIGCTQAQTQPPIQLQLPLPQQQQPPPPPPPPPPSSGMDE